MKPRTIFLIPALILWMAASTASAALSNFGDGWRNVNADTYGITRLQVTVNGANVAVHAWGKCHPQDCDWGTVQGHAYATSAAASLSAKAQAVSAVFKTSFSEAMVLLHSGRGNSLRADVYTRFTDNSGRSNYVRTERFARQRQTSAEDCIEFDYRQAGVERINNHWKLTVGRMWLKDFGAKRTEASQALRILRTYHMNKQCFVGRPNPSMEYYLTNNRSPAGPMSGEDCIGFNPAKIAVSRINGRWKIVEGTHWLMGFGTSEGEARQAYGVLRRYGFTHSCFVGRPQPSMTYFRR